LGGIYALGVFFMGNHEQTLLEYAATGDLEVLPGLCVMAVEAVSVSILGYSMGAC
jgi:hypothetical protein